MEDPVPVFSCRSQSIFLTSLKLCHLVGVKSSFCSLKNSEISSENYLDNGGNYETFSVLYKYFFTFIECK